MQALGMTSRSTSSPLAYSMEGKSRDHLGSNPLRTMMKVLLQSRHVEETRLAQLVADSGETLGEADRMSWDLEKKKNASSSLEDTDSWFGGTFLSG